MPVTQEDKTGNIASFYDGDTGVINEDGSGLARDFYHPGAQVEFVVGELVTYRLLHLPNGKTIVKEIRQK